MRSAVSSPVDHALELIASAEVGSQRTADRARQKLARWRAESAHNEAACQEAERRWQLIGQMAPGLRAQFDEPQGVPLGGNPEKLQRRTLLSLGVVGVGSALFAWRWFPQAEVAQFAKTYTTDKAQLLKVALPDGSHVQLNAQTGLSVALYSHRRTVLLDGGEARFDVAHRADQTFTVQTRNGTVEVVGTVFSVAERGGLMTVSVERGHVRVRSLPSAPNTGLSGNPVLQPEPIDLRAGESVGVRNSVASAVRRIDVQDAAAWRSGWLVFDNTPLGDALPVINAFLETPLQLDSSASALRLTGRFRAMDTQSLLSALPAMLPVTVTTLEPGNYRISKVSAP